MKYHVKFVTNHQAEEVQLGIRIVTMPVGIEQAGPSVVTFDSKTDLVDALRSVDLPAHLAIAGEHPDIVTVDGANLRALSFNVA